MKKQTKEHSNNLLIVPMDEQQPLWPLLHLLNLRIHEELWAIEHRYSLWKDFAGQYNERLLDGTPGHKKMKQRNQKKKSDNRVRNEDDTHYVQ
jgi:hypothetical protein